MKKEEKSKNSTAYEFLFGSNKEETPKNKISNNDNFDTFNSTKKYSFADQLKGMTGSKITFKKDQCQNNLCNHDVSSFKKAY